MVDKITGVISPLEEVEKINEIIDNLGGKEIGEIFYSLTPQTAVGYHLADGTLIQGNGIYSAFVDYIAELYVNSPKKSNVTKVGSLTDNNGVLSGFSTSDYALLPMAINVSTYNWEFVVKINTPDVTTLQTLIGGVNQDYAPFELQLDNGKLKLWLGEAPTVEGAFAQGVLSDTTFNINTDYWIKTVFNGTSYVVSYSTDGSNYVNTISVTSSKVIFSDYLAFGLDKYSNNTIYSGSINLKESYISINGQRWWSGANPSWAVDEATWQNSVTTYGVCGKFVYDSVNNTVRLPKATGFIEGTIDSNTLGNLVEAGLPNIEGVIGAAHSTNGTHSGALGDGAWIGTYIQGTQSQTGLIHANIDFNASWSNSIYGNSNTVQPQAIKGFLYIVIANSTKTETEADIDEIATDLNGKANIDLTNINQDGKNNIIAWGTPDYTNGVSKTSNTIYTAEVSGLLYLYSKGGDVSSVYNTLVIDGETFENRHDNSGYTGWFSNTLIMYVEKGSTYKPTCTTCTFYPLKGAN